MRLEEYWGVGPKTSAQLEATLGTQRAVEAIESMDVAALVDAGLPRGRATRILRHTHGEHGMAMLATSDARAVYKDLLERACEYAITERARDRIRVLTPLTATDAMEERLDDVTRAAETWAALDDSVRSSVLEAFTRFEETTGSELAAVETVRTLQDVGVNTGVFDRVAAVDPDALDDAAGALAALDGGTATSETTVGDGVDDELDALREQRDAAERLEAQGLDVVEAVQSGEVRTSEEFRESFVDYVADRTAIPARRVRELTPAEAADAADFVGNGLRELRTELRDAAEERRRTVENDLQAVLDEHREEIAAAVTVVDDLAVQLSLARFVRAYDLTRPALVGTDGVAVEDARNLALVAAGGDVQPVTYAVGDHECASEVPDGDQVTVLTGANSGGKTTLLETLCQVVLLAHMGLPVPADRAEVSRFDAVVFHRRHASFNAGVLESTLRTIVPPLTRTDRTLMLVDEFEAITEPGSAADLLFGLVRLAIDAGAVGVYVTHLADELEPLPEQARTDGIFATGLRSDLTLDVDYQPRFGSVGQSTPEFIVSRLVANASDRRERAGFEALAEAVGQEAVQRTLLDAQWSE